MTQLLTYQISSLFLYKEMTCRISLQDGDQVLFFASEAPQENLSESLYKMKIRESVQLQTLSAMYEKEIQRDQAMPSCQRLKTMIKGQGHALLSYRSMGNAGTLFEEARGARIRGRSWSIDAHAEQEGLKLRRGGHSKEVQKPCSGVDCQCVSAHLRGGTSFVHNPNLFVTVQLLDDALKVLSLGKLCEEHWYTSEWASGQKPHLTNNGKKFRARRKISILLSQDCLQTQARVHLPHRSCRTHRAPLRVQHDYEVLTLKHRETEAIFPKWKTKT